MNLQIVALTRDHDRSGFGCSDADVDRFLKQKAMQDQVLDLSRTYVLSTEASPNKILGYYTITPIHISQTIMAGDRPKIKRDIPAVLLGQLGVDISFQGRGYGELLLVDAQAKIAQASDLVAFRAMVLDARNEKLAGWYEYYGFMRIGQALRMTKRIETIRRELGGL
jgi:predicted GNAT family N-acyltransferase